MCKIEKGDKFSFTVTNFPISKIYLLIFKFRMMELGKNKAIKHRILILSSITNPESIGSTSYLLKNIAFENWNYAVS